MRVKDLQEFLGSFTEGSEAVKNAVIFVEINGKLHAIRRMEVHENAHPIQSYFVFQYNLIHINSSQFN